MIENDPKSFEKKDYGFNIDVTTFIHTTDTQEWTNKQTKK